MRQDERHRFLNPYPMLDRLWPQARRGHDLNPLVGRIAGVPCFTDRYVQAVLADSPTAYWKALETSGHFIDATGHGYDSTTETTVTYNQTPAPLRDGISRYAIKGNAGTITRGSPDAITNNMCMEIWVNFTSGVGSNRGIMGNDNTVGPTGWGVITPTANKFAVVVQNVAVLANCATTLIPGNWYHILCGKETGSGGAWKYYVNGSLDTTAATSNPAAPTGGTYGLDRGASAMVFNWCHFAYYPTMLSASQVQKHFEAAMVWPF